MAREGCVWEIPPIPQKPRMSKTLDSEKYVDAWSVKTSECIHNDESESIIG